MKNLPLHVSKYLHKYSIDYWKIESRQQKGIKIAVVVPAIAEYNNIKELLHSLSITNNKYFSSTVFIFVLNNLSSSPDEIKFKNYKSLDLLRKILTKRPANDNFIKKIIESKLNIAVIDCASENNELPEKDGGVGLARKIGMDLALTLFDYSADMKNILVCLDADCRISKNYLTEIGNAFFHNNYSAAVINFEHNYPKEDNALRAIICYEIFLRYYVMGLRFAKSPFAFHTIGSAMACTADSYIKVEGMNKKKAAEDFYFLEKLSKVTKINNINKATVYPSGRSSWRVPFGTGQRVNRFLSKTHNEYLLYNPKSFVVLKRWIKLFNLDSTYSTDEYLKAAKEIHPLLYEFLDRQKFKTSINKILSNSSNRNQILMQKIRWFDGFKTLKLIHHLRDNAFGQVNMFDALDEMFYMLNIEAPNRYGVTIPTINIQIEYLDILRKLDKEYNN